MGSNTEKKPWTNLQNSYKNLSKEIKSDNFCYRKVGRAITKWGAIEKSSILLSQYWNLTNKPLLLDRVVMVRVGKDPVYTTCYNCEEHIGGITELSRPGFSIKT